MRSATLTWLAASPNMCALKVWFSPLLLRHTYVYKSQMCLSTSVSLFSWQSLIVLNPPFCLNAGKLRFNMD